MATVQSLNISTQRGVPKTPVEHIELNSLGIIGDAHAGNWHRQVSVLSAESIKHFEAELERPLLAGEFGENITISGLDLTAVAVRDTLQIGDALLEVTQIGKTCHGNGCSIFTQAGKCIMPSEGLFCRVVKAAKIAVGAMVVHVKRPLRFAILTLSDRVCSGEYEDRSGPRIGERINSHFAGSRWHVTLQQEAIPDDADQLQKKVLEYLNAQIDVLITTGGTGIGPRDITPETLLPLFDKEIPGIMDFVRMKYGATIPQALMSRSVAGIIGGMQVYALPGSVKAVSEYMAEILKVLEHNFNMLWRIDSH